MIKELVVAEKEIREFLASRRFMVIFGILLALCIIGMVTGLNQYNQQLDYYKDQVTQHENDPGFALMIKQQQEQLEQMRASGASEDNIKSMEYSIKNQMEPYMPSMLTIFYSVQNPFYMVGMALAIAMGFDLISREKDEGSLKSLLSHPIFRDSVINGKAVAAVAMMAVALAATFLVVIAIMLFSGVVPAGDDVPRIAAFFGVTMLYCIAFLAISVMVSTLVRSSTMSILCLLGIFLLAYSVPSISYPIAQFVAGPSPQQPVYHYSIFVPPNGTVTVGDRTITSEEAQKMNEELQQQSQVDQWEYQNASREYYNRQNGIVELINVISPMSDYSELSGVILNNNKQVTNPYGEYKPWEWNQKVTLWESLSTKWSRLLALIVMSITAFAVSYVAFMRTDIR
jgi:ABC-2 type transport system permease protein